MYNEILTKSAIHQVAKWDSMVVINTGKLVVSSTTGCTLIAFRAKTHPRKIMRSVTKKTIYHLTSMPLYELLCPRELSFSVEI
jgi:hypothetical protein